jgi:hypothetical protein
MGLSMQKKPNDACQGTLPRTAGGGQIKSRSPAIARTGTLQLFKPSLYITVPDRSRKPPGWKTVANCNNNFTGTVPSSATASVRKILLP